MRCSAWPPTLVMGHVRDSALVMSPLQGRTLKLAYQAFSSPLEFFPVSSFRLQITGPNCRLPILVASWILKVLPARFCYLSEALLNPWLMLVTGNNSALSFRLNYQSNLWKRFPLALGGRSFWILDSCVSCLGFLSRFLPRSFTGIYPYSHLPCFSATR